MLHAGDRLTRPEFERLYANMPPGVRAELIEGIVYRPSPVSTNEHGAPHFDLSGWLGLYRAATPGVQGADNATVRLDNDNEPQPDLLLRILPEWGGQSKTDEGYTAGAPELVIEVSASRASYDLHDKLNAYRRNGVREYIVWRVLDGALDWFVLRDGHYVPLPADSSGVIRSEVFPGLWLDAGALLQGDLAQVMRVQQQGLAAPEHAAFLARLESARR